MGTDLTRISEQARKEPELVFTSLYHHISDVDNLRAGLNGQPGSRMYGKSACPVLRGAGVRLAYGRDIVAPSRK